MGTAGPARPGPAMAQIPGAAPEPDAEPETTESDTETTASSRHPGDHPARPDPAALTRLLQQRLAPPAEPPEPPAHREFRDTIVAAAARAWEAAGGTGTGAGTSAMDRHLLRYLALAAERLWRHYVRPAPRPAVLAAPAELARRRAQLALDCAAYFDAAAMRHRLHSEMKAPGDRGGVTGTTRGHRLRSEMKAPGGHHGGVTGATQGHWLRSEMKAPGDRGGITGTARGHRLRSEMKAPGDGGAIPRVTHGHRLGIPVGHLLRLTWPPAPPPRDRLSEELAELQRLPSPELRGVPCRVPADSLEMHGIPRRIPLDSLEMHGIPHRIAADSPRFPLPCMAVHTPCPPPRAVPERPVPARPAATARSLPELREGRRLRDELGLPRPLRRLSAPEMPLPREAPAAPGGGITSAAAQDLQQLARRAAPRAPGEGQRLPPLLAVLTRRREDDARLRRLREQLRQEERDPVLPVPPRHIPADPVLPVPLRRIPVDPVLLVPPRHIPADPVLPMPPRRIPADPVLPAPLRRIPVDPVLPVPPRHILADPVLPMPPRRIPVDPVLLVPPRHIPADPVLPMPPRRIPVDPVLPVPPRHIPADPVLPAPPRRIPVTKPAAPRVPRRALALAVPLRSFGPLCPDPLGAAGLDAEPFPGQGLRELYKELAPGLPRERLRLEHQPLLQPPATEQQLGCTTEPPEPPVVNAELIRPAPGSPATPARLPWKHKGSWHRWWKSAFGFDDFLKFVATGDTDYLHVVFGLRVPGAREEPAAPEPKREQEVPPARAEPRDDPGTECFVPGLWKPGMLEREAAGPAPRRLQQRLERLWAALHVSGWEKLSMAVKYGCAGGSQRLSAALRAWEAAAGRIQERELLLARLEALEESASDPNRWFRRGGTGAAAEARARQRLHVALGRRDAAVAAALRRVRRRFGDTVTFRGRPYRDKMRWDRVEMLYWLQQGRRAAALLPASRRRTEREGAGKGQ